MSFLQPFLLFGLPFVLVPILVHLLNKRRHRTYKWAATMFLVRATQQARGRRRLRHFLILACRVLAVAALIFALSRPLAGGWVSWFGGNRPEAILLLLDRSASMESRIEEGGPTKRANALDRVSSAIREFASGTRIVLFDSAGGSPIELASAEALADLPQTGPSEAGADIPALFEKALDYLATAKPGKAEIWIASDLQASNWAANDGRWQTIRSSYRALGQDPPVRVLGLTGAPASEHGIHLINVWRDGPEVQLDLDIRRVGESSASLPLTVSLDGGAGSQESIEIQEGVLSLRKRIDVGDRKDGGWGRITLGPDLSPADNAIWFAFGPENPLLTTVVSSDRASKILALASAPPGQSSRKSVVLAPEEAHKIDWKNTRLIIWQAPFPDATVGQELTTFLENGGSVLFFPPGSSEASAGSCLGLGWSPEETAPADGKFGILSWETTGGPLANFRDGMPMAMDRVFIIRRRVATGDATVLATFDDGSPAVSRLVVGRGQAVFCSTLPDRRWSDLASYNVLLPLIERLLSSAARFAQDAPTLSLGDPLPIDPATKAAWETVDSAATEGAASTQSRAGVYRRGSTLAAVNVPGAEFLPPALERAELDKLLDGMRARLFEERVSREQGLASEIWRAFAIALLFFLLSEALLSLPGRKVPGIEDALPQPRT
ncbi:MAG: BatA domain-containing protein [Verrucomicrobiales bacterium]